MTKGALMPMPSAAAALASTPETKGTRMVTTGFQPAWREPRWLTRNRTTESSAAAMLSCGFAESNAANEPPMSAQENALAHGG